MNEDHVTLNTSVVIRIEYLVHVTLKASDRTDNGCIPNYSPLLAMALSCPNWHKLFIDEARFHVFRTKDCTDGKEDIIAL